MLLKRSLKPMATATIRPGRSVRGGVARLLLVCLLALGSVAAYSQNQPLKPAVHGGHNHGPVLAKTSSNKPEPKGAALIPDVKVLDQNGATRKFYTDLVKGRVVIINFIYTTCTGICPMSGANFSRVQGLLGARLGRDVHLISVTTDPVTDSPEKLKAWGARFKASAGWTLVTGEKNEMSDLLRALIGEGPRTGYHVPGVFIVNDLKGNHRRAYGLEAPEQLIKLADELAQLPRAGQ